MAEVDEKKMVKNIETRDKIKQSISDAYEEFKTALEKDKSLNKVIEDKTGKPGNLHSNLVAWMQKRWYYILFIVMAVALIFKLMDPQGTPKRSHHKWDSNGRLIY